MTRTVLEKDGPKGRVKITIEPKPEDDDDDDDDVGTDGDAGYPFAVLYLNGQRRGYGDPCVLPPHCRPKGYEHCTHIIGSVYPCTEAEHDLVKAALEQEREAYRAAARAALEVAVPGITELEDAAGEHEDYDYANSRHVANDLLGKRPPAPQTNLAELKRKYPRAALYLRAQEYELASNYHKASAGTAAQKLLEAGGDIEEARKLLDDWLPQDAIYD